MHVNVPPITLLQLLAVIAVVGLFHALVTKRIAVKITWFVVLVGLLIACIYMIVES